MPVLRSAARLLAAQRIERVLIETIPDRWRSFEVSVPAGMRYAARAFGSWRCVVTCTGEAYNWTRPLYKDRYRCDARYQTKRWVLYALDVYCAAPSVAATDVGLQALRSPA